MGKVRAPSQKMRRRLDNDLGRRGPAESFVAEATWLLCPRHVEPYNIWETGRPCLLDTTTDVTAIKGGQ